MGGGELTLRGTTTLSQQQLMHFRVAILLGCRLAQVCQLSPHVEGGYRNAEDSLRDEKQQVLLGAVAVLALHQLEGEEDCPQQQQLPYLKVTHTAGSACRGFASTLVWYPHVFLAAMECQLWE